MKAVSYTQMRKELADILDYLQEGGELTVTRRSKPDLVLSTSRFENNEHNIKQVALNTLTNEDIERAKKLTELIRGYDDILPRFSKIKSVTDSFRLMNPHISNINFKKSLSFQEAFEEVKTDHKEAIKILGDK